MLCFIENMSGWVMLRAKLYYSFHVVFDVMLSIIDNALNYFFQFFSGDDFKLMISAHLRFRFGVDCVLVCDAAYVYNVVFQVVRAFMTIC